MDEHYDLNTARAKLAEYVEKRAVDQNHVQLCNVEVGNYQITQFAQPRSWRLSDFDPSTGDMDEIIFRVQGIVCDKMLPPIMKTTSHDKMVKQRPYLRTAITITGLGDEAFKNAKQKIEEVFMTFSNYFPCDALTGYQCKKLHESDYDVIDTHTRFFNRISSGQSESDDVPFHPLVDPEGVLASMVGDGFIHTTDNDVQFFRLDGSTDDVQRYSVCNPASIRIGDIVEISVAFVVFPGQPNKYKFMLALRGILVLDQKEREKADILRMRQRYTPAKKQVSVLRKTKRQLYDMQEVEETQKRFSKLRVEEEKEDAMSDN